MSVPFGLLSPARAGAGTGCLIGLELEKVPAGLRVKQVVEGSPSAEAQIHPGEEVRAVDGKPVAGAEALIRAVQEKGAGGIVHLTLGPLGGKTREVMVKVALRPEPSAFQKQSLLDKPAPDFVPKVVTGPKLAKLSALQGSVVLIDFWASWCQPCIEALPSVEALHQKLGKKGLRVLGISDEAKAVVTASAKKWKLSYTVAADEDEAISFKYRVYALPTAVVIDRQGVVRAVNVANVAEAERLVEELLAAPATSPTTPPHDKAR